MTSLADDVLRAIITGCLIGPVLYGAHLAIEWIWHNLGP
jgi:hypothetical protein